MENEKKLSILIHNIENWIETHSIVKKNKHDYSKIFVKVNTHEDYFALCIHEEEDPLGMHNAENYDCDVFIVENHQFLNPIIDFLKKKKMKIENTNEEIE